MKEKRIEKIASQTKFFHWIIAFCVIGLLGVGFSFEFIPNGPFKFSLYDLHKSVGILVLLLMVFRLFYRWKYPFPSLPKAHFPFENILARSVEGLLYVCLIAQPLIGWAMSSASGYAVSFFGLFTLPALMGKSAEQAKLFQDLHAIVGICLVGLICFHILGAFYHQFIRKDEVLRRMLPEKIYFRKK